MSKRVAIFLLWFVMLLVAVFALALYGAWALTAEAAFTSAAFVGLSGLTLRRWGFYAWSAAPGRTDVVFWGNLFTASMRGNAIELERHLFL